ncbi:MAG TPA: twin-arginine translocase subunit TatC [Rhodothermales bacterium]|nr:twin-arginine translocase subunit TatC [Rhodothermales bacterium]HRR09617.1 twin-arginine translocase subunit TatC [Rhodothermales bacterium]
MLRLLSRSKKHLKPTQGDGLPAPVNVSHSEGGPEMGFLDHLEELRWHIIKGGAGIVAGMVVCGIFSEFVMHQLLLGPARSDFFVYQWLGLTIPSIDLQNRTITGQFFAYWGTIFIAGLTLGLPVVIYQFWRFIEPGLYPHEKSGMRFVAWFVTFFFILGVVFGYSVLMPMSLQFFARFSISETITNQFDISAYFDMLFASIMGTGMLFELPVVVYALSKLRIVTPDLLRRQRRMALVVILILAALITPSTDMISQIIVAIPLMLLYELSIQISAYVNKKEEEATRKALA